jgi:3-oxoacyl-[acyl-carrier-protein] synthase II
VGEAQGGTGRAVITGCGVVSPNGIGRERFWKNCRNGVSGVRRISLFEPSSLSTQIAGEIDGFEPERFLPIKERSHVSRAVPLAIAAGSEAFSDAGIRVDELTLEQRRRFGVLLGTGGGGLEFTERMYRHWYSGAEKKASVYTIPSSTPGTLSSELSMRFVLRGMSHVISTGCTSSTDAIGYALMNIRARRADRFLVGGVDAPIAHGILAAFCLMRVVTPSWNHAPARGSRPFSRDRDGFVLGEGAWMMIVEDREVALARGARIYAEIGGYGSTCEAYHRVRLDESGEEPARAMSLAIEDAGVAPSEIHYVNLHGTSTEINDRIETRAIRIAFGSDSRRLATSALKSMIGHPQGACGAAGVVETVLAMRDSFLPPTINLDEADPECDLDYVPNEGRPSPIGAALCNCIGFGSKNSALVLLRS